MRLGFLRPAPTWFVGLIIVLALVSGPSQAAVFNVSRCALTASATKDNDIRLDGSDTRAKGAPVVLPRMVADKVRFAANKLLATMASDDPALLEGLTCKDMFSPVYRVSVDGGRELYVADVSAPLGVRFFYLILRDPVTGQVTRTPVRISAKWAEMSGAQDALLKAPLVSTARLPGIPEPMIIFEEQVHNGTVYNAVVYHYFEADPSMNLIRVMALETRLLGLSEDDALYLREVEPAGPSRLRVNLYRVGKDSRRKGLGYAVLGRSGSRVPFRVLEKHPAAGADGGDLITNCGNVRDDDFLRRGCDFYY